MLRNKLSAQKPFTQVLKPVLPEIVSKHGMLPQQTQAEIPEGIYDDPVSFHSHGLLLHTVKLPRALTTLAFF